MGIMDTFNGPELREEMKFAYKDNTGLYGRIDTIVQVYERWLIGQDEDLPPDWQPFSPFPVDTTYDSSPLDSIVITNYEFDEFLRWLPKFENHNAHWGSGEFISDLIQRAYDAGSNNFTIPTKEHTVSYGLAFTQLGINLSGTEENPLVFTIDGNTGTHTAIGAKHVHLTITGDMGGRSLVGLKHCTVKVHGTVYEPFNGMGSIHTDFYANSNQNLHNIHHFRNFDSHDNRYFLMHSNGTIEQRDLSGNH